MVIFIYHINDLIFWHWEFYDIFR